MCVKHWYVCICNVTHLYVWHDALISISVVAAHNLVCVYMYRHSFICVTWPIYTCFRRRNIQTVCECKITHSISHVWHDSPILVSVLEIHTQIRVKMYRDSPADMCVIWRDSFIRVTRLTHTCLRRENTHPDCMCEWDMTHSHVWHDSLTSKHPRSCVTWWHSHVWHDSHIPVSVVEIHTPTGSWVTCAHTHTATHMCYRQTDRQTRAATHQQRERECVWHMCVSVAHSHTHTPMDFLVYSCLTQIHRYTDTQVHRYTDT